MGFLIGAITAAVVALFLLVLAVRILREYQRAVIFRLGRLIAQKGPGLILLIPVIDRMVRVDLRTVTLDVPPQEVITRDNVPARVNAVAYFRIVNANDSVVEITVTRTPRRCTASTSERKSPSPENRII